MLLISKIYKVLSHQLKYTFKIRMVPKDQLFCDEYLPIWHWASKSFATSYHRVLSVCTVGKNASFFVIFGHICEKGYFLHYLAYCEEMTLNYEKTTSIPRVSIYNLSFETSLMRIFKYLLSKTIRQISLLFLFLRPKNGQISEFCRMVLSTKYLNIFVKLGSNDRLWIETLGIGALLANLAVIFSGYAY